MNKKEILRYLRTASNTADERLLLLIDECCAEVEQYVVPKTLHRIFDCKVCESRVLVEKYEFAGKRLAENLHGCKQLILFGATLGTECDRLLRTYSTVDITRTAVLQACLAAKIEEVCDTLEDRLRADGYTLRPRYSPGYFDLDITENKKIFELLDLTKRIGLSLTDTYQMVPTKSVTAFIGIEND